jgi:hypothetical protein
VLGGNILRLIRNAIVGPAAARVLVRGAHPAPATGLPPTRAAAEPHPAGGLQLEYEL